MTTCGVVRHTKNCGWCMRRVGVLRFTCSHPANPVLALSLVLSRLACLQYKQKTHLLRLLNPSAHNDARAVKDTFVDKFMAGTS